MAHLHRSNSFNGAIAALLLTLAPVPLLIASTPLIASAQTTQDRNAEGDRLWQQQRSRLHFFPFSNPNQQAQ